MSDNTKKPDEKDGKLRKKIETAVLTVSVDNQDPVYNAKKEVLVPYIKTETEVTEVAGGAIKAKKGKAGNAPSPDKQNSVHNTRKEALGPNIGR